MSYLVKVNYLDSPRLLYKSHIGFYRTEIIYDKDFGSAKQILGMKIYLSERLKDSQIKMLDCIDTFEMLSPTTILFKTFARMERESNCNT